MLAARAPDLARELLPGGVKDGPEWRCGSLAGEPGRSFALRLSGERAGIWCDFASGEAGDALDLVAQCACGGDKRAAVRWAKAWLGLDGQAPDARQRRQATQRALRAAQGDGAADGADDAARRQRVAAALRLWLAGQASIAGTPVDRYLKARAIDLAELGRQPRALRFHPTCFHGPTQARRPAMVAAICDAGGRHIGTHRTWLAPDASGRWGKAAIPGNKRVYGSHKGGTIRLWRGRSRRPLAEAGPDETIAIAEGIEDGLTVALACPDWRVLAAVSVGNLGELELPPAVKDIVLVCQRDGENREVRRAHERALTRWQAEGRRPRLAWPPEGFKDFNDWAQAERSSEAS